MSHKTQDERSPSRRNDFSLEAVIVFTAFMASFTFLIIVVCYCLSRNSRLRRHTAHGPQTFRSPISSIASSSTTDVGLKEEALHSLPVFVYSSTSGKLECPVCLEDFKEGDKGRVLPGCDHQFHVECVDVWLMSNSSCPVCRSVVKIQSSDW